MGLVREEFLYICPADLPEPPAIPDGPVILREDVTDWGRRITIIRETAPTPLTPLEGRSILASAVFPADIPGPITVRKRRDGDRILSHGMHKKLKKLMQEKDIPLHLRDTIPLFCIPGDSPEGEPLWCPSVAFRDGYPTPTEGPCLRITVEYRYPTRLEK